MSAEIPNYLALALARLLRTERHAMSVAAAEHRNACADPAMAAVWQAIAITCAKVDDAEQEMLARLSGPSGTATCE